MDAFIFVKPEEYKSMDAEAQRQLMYTDQRVLPFVKKLVAAGEQQLKNQTGYNSENLPSISPIKTDPFSLDGIVFSLQTTVKVNNPKYQTAYDQIIGFLEVLTNDWNSGVSKQGVRTYSIEAQHIDGKTEYEKSPFVEWNYLMWNAMKYIGRTTDLGVANEIKEMTVPKELEDVKINRLVVPIDVLTKFDIEKPGTAKIWYLANKFLEATITDTVEPVEEEMDKRSGITVEDLPKTTVEFCEQFDDLLNKVTYTPSERRQPGKALKRLFEIPQKDKPKGSLALPIVPTQDNYQSILDDYAPVLPTSLKKWKDLDEKIGEVVVFHYGIEDNPRVQAEMPYLDAYRLKREDTKMFLSIQALYDRMKALEKDYVTNRLLKKHEVVKIV